MLDIESVAFHNSSKMMWSTLSTITSVICIGSCYVPVKIYRVGDGMIHQFVMANALISPILAFTVSRGFARFHSVVMTGGVMMATANLILPLTIRMLGFSLTFFIFVMFSLIPVWFAGRFGLFGLTKVVPSSNAMNIIGMIICVLGCIPFLFIKTYDCDCESMSVMFMSYESPYKPHFRLPWKKKEAPATETETSADVPHQGVPHEVRHGDDICHCEENVRKIRITGAVAAAYAGTLFGASRIPIVHVMQSSTEASRNIFDYFFSYFSGNLLTANIYFLLYVILTGKGRILFEKSAMPSYICGLVFSLGFFFNIISSAMVSSYIILPASTAGTMLVVTFWSLCITKEIQDLKNHIIYVSGVGICIVGIIILAFSYTVGGGGGEE